MSVDVKFESKPGQAHVRALARWNAYLAETQYGVALLYHYETHQEQQAVRSKLQFGAVGPVLAPGTAFRVGAQMILASVICGVRRLFAAIQRRIIR